MSLFEVKEYSYDLPPELIAQSPASRRDASRLMVLKRDGGETDCVFSDIISYLQPGDTLVINETAVIHARLYGVREATGAKVEILLLKQTGDTVWEALVRPGKRVREGEWLSFGDGVLRAYVKGRTDAGGRVLQFDCQEDFYALLDRIGEMPLPPYIHEKPSDPSRYQTVYAKELGSAAAPTAGLHFTQELLEQIAQKGVRIARVLLHVGLGTFRPVEVEDIRDHHMHSEYYRITEEAAEAIRAAHAQGGRVIAVGTTSIRVLESACDENGDIHAQEGWTDIFIYPGYQFKVVDGMVTNFHLPNSTLLMLVCAFLGYDRTMEAYRQAVQKRYRFFSFGDAMLIL